MIALKLPIGLGLLVLTGLFLFFTRGLPPEWNLPITIILAASVLFLLLLATGSTYGGIRHALPVVILLAFVGGVTVPAALASKSMLLKAYVAAALVAAAVSAIPVMRPWEYFNEIIGGAEKGYLYFSDEGVDLWQRGKELAAYYHGVLEPAGEVPLLAYGADVGVIGPEEKAHHLDGVRYDGARDEARFTSPVFSGTLLVNARYLGRKPFWDLPSLRNATPSARFGNLMVFRGTFSCGGLFASVLYFDAESRIYAEKPDYHKAERLLRQSIALDPSQFFAEIELGNLLLKRGAREDSVLAYSEALRHVPTDPEFHARSGNKSNGCRPDRWIESLHCGIRSWNDSFVSPVFTWLRNAQTTDLLTACSDVEGIS